MWSWSTDFEKYEESCLGILALGVRYAEVEKWPWLRHLYYDRVSLVTTLVSGPCKLACGICPMIGASFVAELASWLSNAWSRHLLHDRMLGLALWWMTRWVIIFLPNPGSVCFIHMPLGQWCMVRPVQGQSSILYDFHASLVCFLRNIIIASWRNLLFSWVLALLCVVT